MLPSDAVSLILTYYRGEKEIYNEIDDSYIQRAANILIGKGFLKREEALYILTKDDDLMNVSSYGYTNIVKILLSNRTYSQWIIDRSFVCACKHNHLKIVQLLFDKGADIHYNTKESLYTAFCERRIEIIKFLMKNGRYNYSDYLTFSCELKFIEGVQLLLEYGADVQIDENDALITSCKINFIEGVRLLLEYGANVHARYGEALLQASSRGNIEITTMLLERGAIVSIEHNLPLRTACEKQNRNMVRLLLKYGADINIIKDSLLKSRKIRSLVSKLR